MPDASLVKPQQDADALHRMGLACAREGDKMALDYLAQATRAAPRRADIAASYGLALLRAGQPQAAATQFAHAARLQPQWPDAPYNLGVALREAGSLAAAKRAFRRAIALRPDYPHAELNLAALCRQTGEPAQALPIYREVLRRHPTLADAWNSLGAALVEGGDTPEAARAFRAALRLNPGFATAQVNLASVLLLQDSAAAQAEAQSLYAAALPALAATHAAAPSAESAAILAEAQRGLRRYAQAASLLLQAVAAYPAVIRLRLDLADTQIALGQADQALTTLDGAPSGGAAAPAMRRRGLLLRGMALRDQQRLDESAASLRQAIKVADAPVARYQLAQCLLQAGVWAAGFAAFEARAALHPSAALPGHVPLWDGEHPAGRHVLVVQEQGLGDTIQFARYLPLLAARGAKVTAAVAPSLVRLLQPLPGISLVPLEGALPAVDLACRIMSLPHLLAEGDPAFDPAPDGRGYLRAEAAGLAAWRHWLMQHADAPHRLTVGLCWAGSPAYAMDHARSIPPAKLAPLAQPSIRFVSLQPGADPCAIPGLTLRDPSARLTDLADTAALIAALDLVITVDTVIAHLAGALGRPVWLLNRANTDWRWMSGRADSPWYESLRMFRQPAPGDWKSPIAAAAAALADRAASA